MKKSTESPLLMTLAMCAYMKESPHCVTSGESIENMVAQNLALPQRKPNKIQHARALVPCTALCR